MLYKFCIHFLLILFLIKLNVAQGQSSAILDNFTGIAEPTQVQLRWVISSGQTCDGTIIERSGNALQWERIGEIPGVCGNSATPVTYNFIDDSPLQNSINYYRLELGNSGYSKIINVPFYNFAEKGYVIIPNPASQLIKFYFGNSISEKFRISFFASSGVSVHTHEGSGGFYEYNISSFAAGVYYFIISRTSLQDVKGSFIVR